MEERKFGRRFFRLKPDNPVHADMRIMQIGSNRVRTGCAKVSIIDISPGGMRFSSKLDLPVRPLIVLNFCMPTSEGTVLLDGYITHRIVHDNGHFEYGTCFIRTDKLLRKYLLKLFNNKITHLGKYLILMKFD